MKVDHRGKVRHGLFRALRVLALVACGASQASPSLPSIDAELSSIARDTGVPGITFSIHGRRLSRNYAAGYADRETRAPMRPDSLMMGASTGKMLVAVLVYQEVERGRLNYSDKIERFFGKDSAYHQLPGAAQFTVSMLLRHSSGLVDGAVDAAAIRDSLGEWTNERRFLAARGTRLLFEPASAFSYSDLNYQILAAVVESIEGRYFGDLAIERIIQPLAMSGTFPAISQQISGLASGYAGPTDKPQYEDIKLPDKTAAVGRLFMNPAFEGGGGGFVTDSSDMANFIYSLFQGKLIKPRELSYMTSGLVPVSGRGKSTAYAAGLFRYRSRLGPAFGHSGIWFGYKTMVLYYPTRCVGAAMQVNSQIDGDGNDLAQYQLHGRRFTMVEMLTELAASELRVERKSSACDLN